MTDLGYQPGFARDLDAIVRAFNAGLQFDPPAVSVNEFRAALRRAGMPMGADGIQMPEFEIPEFEPETDDEDEDTPPEPPEESD